ncbi:MAG TPA: hypothetical protein VFQ61_22860, partial [Polyangiaceae bacterium]|nr:hypothetical protein [Polyangiaceae bacterium]
EWSHLSDGSRACLLVADDRKGLLAQVTRAFSAFQFDITSAQIFCRTRADGSVEAVDFFWVRAAPGSHPSGASIEHVQERLISLLSRAEPVSQVGSSPGNLFGAGQPSQPVVSSATTRVYFEPEALAVGQSVLVVETADYPGLLFAITNALFRTKVEVVASDVRTSGGVARDRFTVTNTDGRPLTGARLKEVCDVVETSIRKVNPRSNGRSN